MNRAIKLMCECGKESTWIHNCSDVMPVEKKERPMLEYEIRMEHVQQLDEALHGTTWARNASPMSVWNQLLEEVKELVNRTGNTSRNWLEDEYGHRDYQ